MENFFYAIGDTHGLKNNYLDVYFIADTAKFVAKQRASADASHCRIMYKVSASSPKIVKRLYGMDRSLRTMYKIIENLGDFSKYVAE